MSPSHSRRPWATPIGARRTADGGRCFHYDGTGLARAELDASPGAWGDPARAAHPLEIDPAYAEPGRGLLRAERRLTVQQLCQGLPGGDLVHLTGVEGSCPVGGR
ncbi:hypothetical protein ACFXPI_03355 [Streptomyces sp. NPDC059104]|uniref:hypothetical protein n=1 Tax=Streptomyces sp. NPDC059104 TaxID=3346729 RepID=UPI00367BA018